MPETFLTLSRAERQEALAVAADASGRPADILEKDVWVVEALSILFGSPDGERLCFKGGTSLSKAFRVISRFSEDVDITYDIRAMLSDELGGSDADPRPSSRSQAKKWTKVVRRRLPEWVAEVMLPHFAARLETDGAPAQARADRERILLAYDQASASAGGYLTPTITVEFGARATGEPMRKVPVACDASAHLPAELLFPSALPRVMAAERTFWEKATAAHAYCLEEQLRGERYARHWYDLARLDEVGIAASALADRELGRVVADHKARFFEVRAASGEWVDYGAAVAGSLQLVPERGPREALEDDYERMVAAGLLEIDAPTFDSIMDRCGEIEARANSV